MIDRIEYQVDHAVEYVDRANRGMTKINEMHSFIYGNINTKFLNNFSRYEKGSRVRKQSEKGKFSIFKSVKLFA